MGGVGLSIRLGPGLVWTPGALSRQAFECLGREEEGRWGPWGLAILLTVVFVTTSRKPTGNPRPPARRNGPLSSSFQSSKRLWSSCTKMAPSRRGNS